MSPLKEGQESRVERKTPRLPCDIRYDADLLGARHPSQCVDFELPSSTDGAGSAMGLACVPARV